MTRPRESAGKECILTDSMPVKTVGVSRNISSSWGLRESRVRERLCQTSMLDLTMTGRPKL
jgi:hypothetical protein